MSGTSNVGNSQVYQADDQRTVPNSEIEQQKKDNRFHEGKENSHKANDSKDERSIANKLAREEKSKQMVQGLIILTSLQRQNEEEYEPEEVKQSKRDPTLPAKMHGNEPSKGAKVDAEIQAEEEEELRRKGKA
ncbi:hypothetical protein LHYA1_G005747 [Lachnellula hyalina]|uniref:Uncharacterized protein n=1 Tax=Lachnellula hyalina TaxID=1316788 RepID=A0A8H8TZY5_9HELO|nr:uncharacterized protein LHYA1_G005747 [Lachnellula hyalina]TVY25496.1 hypothetical protein LHYA1_G005747 [Lachnellula hyalina]